MELTLKRTVTQTKEELEIAARRTILEMEYVFNHPLTKENKKNLELEVLRKEKNLTDGSICAKDSARNWCITNRLDFDPKYIAKLLAKRKTKYIRDWNGRISIKTDTRIRISVENNASNKRKIEIRKQKSENQKRKEKLRSKKQRKEKRMKQKKETMTEDELLEYEIRKVIDRREDVTMEIQTEKLLDTEEKKLEINVTGNVHTIPENNDFLSSEFKKQLSSEIITNKIYRPEDLFDKRNKFGQCITKTKPQHHDMEYWDVI